MRPLTFVSKTTSMSSSAISPTFSTPFTSPALLTSRSTVNARTELISQQGFWNIRNLSELTLLQVFRDLRQDVFHLIRLGDIQFDSLYSCILISLQTKLFGLFELLFASCSQDNGAPRFCEQDGGISADAWNGRLSWELDDRALVEYFT